MSTRPVSLRRSARIARLRLHPERSATFVVISCLLVIAASLPLISFQVASAALVETVGPNINVNQAAGSQAEATIAVDPADPQRIFVASNPGGTAAVSTDGGANWTRYTIPNVCCDNVATFDQFGNLFLVNINSALNSIDLYLSTNGGASFGAPTAIDTGGIDQPTVAVGAGTVWVTWNNAGTIFASGAQVTGLGVVGAFSAPQAAPNSNAVSGQFGDIAVGPAGQVMVTYQSNTQIFINTDPDGLGAGGFGAQVTVTNMNVAKFDSIEPQDSRTIDSEVGLVYDTQGANSGRVYMIYTDETPDESDDTDIIMRFSDNDGANWSAPLQVNDDATSNSQFLPHIDVDQGTGYIGVTWHDARNDPGNNNTQLWGAFSVDGGASFRPNFQISAGTSNEDTAASGVDYGDYRWSDFVNGVLYPVWADNSNSTGDNPAGANSTFDIYMAAVTIAEAVPEISSVTNSGPINEGETATITVTATHPLGETLSYEFDCDNDSTFEIGPQPANTAPCSFGDNGNFTVNVRVTDQSTNSVTGSTVVVVNNLPPVINDITTSAVAAAITLTVDATDPADATLFPFTGDTLSYSFDCDNNLVFEIGPQLANSGTCNFGMATGQFIINVQVDDEDGGSASGSVTVWISKLCVNRSTGVVRTLTTCTSSELTVWLPQQAPVTLCKSTSTGVARLSLNGSCTPSEQKIIAQGDGSIAVCANIYTGVARIPNVPGTCTASEKATQF